MSNPFRPVNPASTSFLPEDYIARKTETRVNVLILGLFALVLGGIVAAYAVTYRQWNEVNAHKVSVNDQWTLEGQKMDQLKGLVDQRASMMKKAEITAALVERVPRWAVLGEVTLRMPMDMKLEQFIIKSARTDPVVAPKAGPVAAGPVVKTLTDKITGAAARPEEPKIQAPKYTYTITIIGSTAKNTEVADFLASLKNSPALMNVELSYIREAKEKDHEVRKYEISANIRNDADTVVLANSLQRLIADRTALINPNQPATAAAVTVEPEIAGSEKGVK
jgi:hypothetical protein